MALYAARRKDILQHIRDNPGITTGELARVFPNRTKVRSAISQLEGWKKIEGSARKGWTWLSDLRSRRGTPGVKTQKPTDKDRG